MTAREARLIVDGVIRRVPASITVAAALLSLDLPFRRSVSGQHRAALCGMGVCFECRVRIDGVAQQRACQVTVRDGMTVDSE
ncbi:MAG: (2Fe-2S)-binding protein [Luteibacter sp.]|uniref:(2Fe-2S)-binding protein n=1 Tax=unclassified Luteibacter TaxID=2620188 RepID=UPI002807C165|nr:MULTISPECIES: (2Fe-2S)-binding protein [unclassified Luteibacter]MDQ7994910.1 (2Fe-2S)-binding protein [Luteibacter sp.]MDQ8047576.1 (2Fe-2S)-binding protein [Luteibacter sp.]MDR6641234.1 sarcosine oxidase subunit alpha [Luteibacter sp. 1214]